MRGLVGLAAVVLVLAGCGTGEPEAVEPTPAPPYFAQLAALTSALDEADAQAEDELRAELEAADDVDRAHLMAATARRAATRFEAAAEDMSRLRPPPMLTEAHAELIAASLALVEQERTAADHLATLGPGELHGLSPRPAQVAAERRVQAACADLQTAASEAGAQADLCVGVFAGP